VLLRAVDRLAAAEKVYTTYAASWLRYVTPQYRVHSSYNQIEQRDEEGIPKTGRLGSSDPNAQNVSNKPIHLLACGCEDCRKEEPERPPTKSKLTISIRRYYIVPKGFVRVFIDLSQIELRVLAWFSQDKRLLYCYANDLDVHQMTADEVTGGNRKVAKEVNFGNNYGMTKIGLAKRLTYYADDPDRALADAEVYLTKFFETYAGIPVFRDRLANEMRSNGCMFVNPFGRPRRIPTIASPDRQERARAERMMMSSIISGTSADLLKEIILRTRDVLKVEYGHMPYAERGRQVQTIHDENVYDLPIAGVGHVLPKLMKSYTDWPMFERGGVPIRASCELSTTTWEDKRPITIHEDGTFSWAA
jgi:DNA polymerase-1